jgi:hypothetical protein
MLGAMQQSWRYFVTGLTTDGGSLRTEADSPFDAIQLAGQWIEAGISDVQIVDRDGQTHDLAEFKANHADRT